MRIRSVKGVKDVLPALAGGEVEAFQRLETLCRKLLEDYGYHEIKIPLFEYTELFTRSIGVSTDIVEKEMYTFQDRDGSSITLRPEGTASVVRALIQHNLANVLPIAKLYYAGPMFRHERPQAGRFRQFHQIGAEVFGADSPTVDIELLEMLHKLLVLLQIGGFEIQINTLGCPVCRPAYREKLVGYLEGRSDRLCENCLRRLRTNPLRILDCRESGCRAATEDAPAITHSLCAACRDHFGEVQEGLDLLKVPFHLNARLVRGLDYYVRTAFEITAHGLGAQNAVAAGGRYDGLVAQLGGPDIPGIGFALGVERLIALMDPGTFATPGPQLFIAALGQAAQRAALEAMPRLRQEGVRTEMMHEAGSLKSQMRRADRLGVRWVAIIGEEELRKGRIVIRDMKTKEQRELPLSTWTEEAVRLASGIISS